MMAFAAGSYVSQFGSSSYDRRMMMMMMRNESSLHGKRYNVVALRFRYQYSNVNR